MRLLAAIAALTVAVSGSAQAAEPIHACVNSKNGKIRIVPSGTICGSKESPLVWNTEAPRQLVGLTIATLSGDAGVLAFTQACQKEFPATRFCTSEEIIRTTSVPAGLSGSAWVLFSPVGSSGTGAVFDASGQWGTGSSFTCAGWSDSGSISNPYSGLTVAFGARYGAFSPQVCSEARRVACCGP